MARFASIKTADKEIAMTYELMQAMKRGYPGDLKMRQRAVLHMAMQKMRDAIVVNENGIYLRLS
jgi:hypothetical protein